ncbi:MAG TPA: hypothetical protein VKC53_02175 [Patescibacteria group bacterium]|nr:hypothetical protein [Patescibacteria group bacterium]
MDENLIRVDGIKWHTYVNSMRGRSVQPLCPTHNMRLSGADYDRALRCEECSKLYPIPRNLFDEEHYVLDRIDANKFKAMKVINLDDESIPIAEDKIEAKDSKYFITSRLMKSKTGLRLVVYAGEKGGNKKTQIFVEPDIKRLAFDQKDLHPSDIFVELEATFIDGTKHKIKK